MLGAEMSTAKVLLTGKLPRTRGGYCRSVTAIRKPETTLDISHRELVPQGMKHKEANLDSEATQKLATL